MNITPKRAAALTIYDSLVDGGLIHYLMDMVSTSVTDNYDWNMTEKREEKLKEEMAKILQPLIKKCIKTIEPFVEISETEVNTDY